MTTSNSFSEIFRPKTPAQLIGETQRAVAKVLLQKVESKEIAREVLFVGESGIGKTTIARMYIQALLGQDVDIDNFVHDINCSAENGIDFVRNGIIEKLHFLPIGVSYMVFFLDEIHGLSNQAQNALLTEIEPLPSHVVMVASTTNPEKLIPTLRSRFTEYKLPIPTNADFELKAKWIFAKSFNGEAESKYKAQKSLIDEIIGISRGNVRTFDRYLQQLVEGSYRGVADETEDKSKLFDLIFKEQLDLFRLYQEAEKEKDYVGTSIALCNYAIKVLENPTNRGNPIGNRSRKVIETFGDGLNKNVPDKVSFYKKLLEFVQ